VPEQWRGNGAFPSYAGARNDLAIAEAEQPTGGEAQAVLLGAIYPKIWLKILDKNQKRRYCYKNIEKYKGVKNGKTILR
jgi:hypothetical protein